ncbi:hypothetical protein EW093_02090 [Thiospirochaeta perfilievii]|uniref:DUF4292 domain-containing protein n=1 Tax=Thiospirochaeta perfilievii TaxID=252967 RepID=A0A5C1Q876_9SPIO|nr:hypothetical protein [Thiospirochaeta perfilievii]QEN03538.1 hypothetical protein EW093_02090 [Thiospirochaeta perfilievii]
MKTKFLKERVFSISLILSLFLFSCENGVVIDSASKLEDLEKQEVSIYNGDNKDEDIISYSANVKSYYSHDKKGIDSELTQEYRMSLKLIDSQLYTRIDVPGNQFSDLRNRSIVTSPTETIVFFEDTDEVEARIPIESTSNDFLGINNRLPILGRLDLNSITTEAKRLSFDVEDVTPGILTVSLPSSAFEQTGGVYNDYTQDVLSYKLSFDTEENTLASTEMIVAESDGTIMTVNTYDLFHEDENGELIKTGRYTAVHNNLNMEISIDDADIETYETLDDIPEISKDEIATLVEEGSISEADVEPWLGDPTDPNFTEIFIELYEDVELNTLEDSLFRVGL